MISKDLLKGTLKTIVLKLLSENQRMYGYEITQKVEELSNGSVKLTFGALYPVLHKLETEGYVHAEKVSIGKRVRIYYMLTKNGKSWASSKLDEYIEFVKVMNYILNPNQSRA
ncbi:MAG: helix-turn-helix transcriptional regulator [Bacteroidales bacterium]|nr:helix-turn-helix transcriptional regulator [Bacteroidales bacterium]